MRTATASDSAPSAVACIERTRPDRIPTVTTATKTNALAALLGEASTSPPPAIRSTGTSGPGGRSRSGCRYSQTSPASTQRTSRIVTASPRPAVPAPSRDGLITDQVTSARPTRRMTNEVRRSRLANSMVWWNVTGRPVRPEPAVHDGPRRRSALGGRRSRELGGARQRGPCPVAAEVEQPGAAEHLEHRHRQQRVGPGLPAGDRVGRAEVPQRGGAAVVDPDEEGEAQTHAEHPEES